MDQPYLKGSAAMNRPPLLFLIACSGQQGKLWRVRECMPKPESFNGKAFTFRNGIWLIASAQPRTPGQFIVPADLIRSIERRKK